MRIVTLEEHLSFPALTSLIPKEISDKHSFGFGPSNMMNDIAAKLADVNGGRLKSMNDSGITMQILSVSGAGADLLSADEGPALAYQYNDAIAQKIAAHPDRFAAFAHLPMTAPEAAADELSRTVETYGFKGALINGMTNEQFLDNLKYAPILKRAEELQVPIYLHPGLPPRAVEQAYYTNLPKFSGKLLSIAGWGWHSETALHVLRLIVSGTLDRFPKLKLIIGHMGEMLPMMMARCDNMFKPDTSGINQRSIIDTLRQQVMITTSGIFTTPPLMCAIETFGIDNVMFSVDYPYSTNEQGIKFLESVKLPTEQIEKLAHGNADRLMKLAHAAR